MTLYEKCQQSGDTELHDEYVYIAQTGSGEIEIPLMGEQVKSIATMGENDIAVEAVANTPEIQQWMKKYPDEVLRQALLEYGNWDEEELGDRQSNIQRLVWVLAWDLFDSDNPNDYLAADEYQKL